MCEIVIVCYCIVLINHTPIISYGFGIWYGGGGGGAIRGALINIIFALFKNKFL